MLTKVDPNARLLGLDKLWIAPLAIVEAARGFDRETWIEAVPGTLIAMRLSGEKVTAQWGRRRGVTSMPGADIALQPAGTPNHYTAPGRCSFAQIYLPDSLIDRVAAGLQPGSPASGLLRDDLIFLADAEFELRVKTYIRAAMSNASSVEMECRAILIVERLLSQFHGFVSPDEADDHRGGLADWQLNRVEDLLRSDLSRNFSLEHIAARAHISPFHFARCFRKSTGLPPHRYLVKLRIEKAKELLEHSTLPITDIAADVGYDDPSYFARLFQKQVGVTPSQYRRERRS
jgi:AraC-like DNA-binding protein